MQILTDPAPPLSNLLDTRTVHHQIPPSHSEGAQYGLEMKAGRNSRRMRLGTPVVLSPSLEVLMPHLIENGDQLGRRRRRRKLIVENTMPVKLMHLNPITMRT